MGKAFISGGASEFKKWWDRCKDDAYVYGYDDQQIAHYAMRLAI